MENGLSYIARFQNTVQQGAHFFNEDKNPELEHRVKKVTEKISENLNIISNEPSLAYYRIQEHVRRSLPQLVVKKHEIQDTHEQVKGSCYDTEYATKAVETMAKSKPHFTNIQELLKNAMFMKQQISYERSRQKAMREKERLRPSMYRPAMQRTHTVDVSNFTHSADHAAIATAQPPPDRHHTYPQELVSGSPRNRSSSLTHRSPGRPRSAAPTVNIPDMIRAMSQSESPSRSPETATGQSQRKGSTSDKLESTAQPSNIPGTPTQTDKKSRRKSSKS